MSDPRPGLISAIRDHPGDDTARLVYADWCEEAGDLPRAEFIRAQIEAAGLPPWNPRRGELLDRAEMLLTQYEAEWLGPWADRLVRWQFRRGFLHAASLTDTAFLAHGEALFREYPLPRVGFVDVQGEPLQDAGVRAVVGQRSFRHVRSLDFLGVAPHDQPHLQWNLPYNQGGVPVESWLRELAIHPHVRLREFRPGARFRRRVTVGISLELLAAFCQAPHLRTLRSLDLSERAVGNLVQPREEGTELLAKATFAPELRRLALRGWFLPGGAIAPLATAFPNLTGLALPMHRISDVDILQILSAPGLANLADFEVSEASLPALAASPLAGRLRRLLVMDRDRDEETRAETQTAWLRLLEMAPPLRELHLVCHDPGRVALRTMQQSRALRRVHTLVLRNDSQSDGIFRLRGLARLLRSGTLPQLTRLHLHEFATVEFLESLRGWRGLRRLEEFVTTDDYHGRLIPSIHEDYPLGAQLRELRGVRIANAADLDNLSAWDCLPSVRRLALAFSAPIARGDLEIFFRQPELQRLEYLRILYQSSQGGNELPLHLSEILANPDVLPRLTTLWIPNESDPARLARLRTRFGARLKV